MVYLNSRSPLGLRGLKFWMHEYQKAYQESQPSWAAWIEIRAVICGCVWLVVAALVGGGA